ncbi:hypothetical protein SEVIR_3G133875v4 [Setaria viridis]
MLIFATCVRVQSSRDQARRPSLLSLTPLTLTGAPCQGLLNGIMGRLAGPPHPTTASQTKPPAAPRLRSSSTREIESPPNEFEDRQRMTGVDYSRPPPQDPLEAKKRQAAEKEAKEAAEEAKEKEAAVEKKQKKKIAPVVFKRIVRGTLHPPSPIIWREEISWS